MSAGINRYRVDLRELSFVLFEQFGYADLAGKPPFDAWGVEEARAVLSETHRIARDVFGPLNASGDREGCRLEGGQVRTPAGFREAWKTLYETGLRSIAVSPEFGGQGGPRCLQVLVEEMLSGANTSLFMYSGLTLGAAELLLECGTPEQKRRYVERLVSGAWAGTMCLTEPHAGSDVGTASTSAERLPDGRYRIRGTKIFISGGDHDLTENIIHLVLARVVGAPPGTKGLSLFIVPKFRLREDGSPGERNDVQTASIEHKMGINGSSTCVLNFGEADGCIGELVGGVEHAGMGQMFRLMNIARIGVGLQGLGVVSSAYLNALDYAKERRQGAHFRFWKDPTKPRVPILEHPDVRRMLLECKAITEGIRMLLVKLTAHVDRAHQLAGADAEKAAYHQGQVELLTPIVKAYSTDEAFRLTAQAIQIYGGAGFLKDHPVEQYCRDAKVFSIYEGTNHIQAMDLIGRKLPQAGGTYFQQFMGDVAAFVEAHRAHPSLGKAVEALESAHQAVLGAAMGMLQWSQSDKLQLVLLSANRFLMMMGHLAVGWLLLDAAERAERVLPAVAEGHPDRDFYLGKRYSALWFARNVLPQVKTMGRIAAAEDASPMEIPDAAFSST